MSVKFGQDSAAAEEVVKAILIRQRNGPLGDAELARYIVDSALHAADTGLNADERAAIAALIENEMSDGSSKYGKVGHGLVRLDTLLEKFEDDESEVPYPDGAPEPNWWDDRIDPR